MCLQTQEGQYNGGVAVRTMALANGRKYDDIENEVFALCEDIHMPTRAVEALRRVYADPDGMYLNDLRCFVEPLACADYTRSEWAGKELAAAASGTLSVVDAHGRSVAVNAHDCNDATDSDGRYEAAGAGVAGDVNADIVELAGVESADDTGIASDGGIIVNTGIASGAGDIIDTADIAKVVDAVKPANSVGNVNTTEIAVDTDVAADASAAGVVNVGNTVADIDTSEVVKVADGGKTGVTDVSNVTDTPVDTDTANTTNTAETRAVAALAVTLEAALRSWETIYVPRGIGRDVFTATMANIALFMGERIAAYDDVAFDRAWWCWQYTSGKQYRIGTLNFEMAVSHGNAQEAPFVAGQRLLHVHIPSDARLDPEHTHAAYRAARGFFAAHYPLWAGSPMVTKTWLLSPVLRPMLPERSRILAFARDYEVLHVTPDSDDGNFFVFGRSDLPLGELPQQTGLQRSAAALLQAGGHIGVAFGRLRLDD